MRKNYNSQFLGKPFFLDTYNHRRNLNTHTFNSKMGDWLRILGATVIVLAIVAIFAFAMLGGIYLLSWVVSMGWHEGK